MSNVYRLTIREGQFGGNFGPNFDIASGAAGMPIGLILALARKKKKKKLGREDLNRMRQLIRLLDRLDMIRLGQTA